MGRFSISPDSHRWRSVLASAGILGGALLLSLPTLIWHHQPARELDVLIVDKTVPDTTRREHAGLTWLLNHRKFRKRDGSVYRADRDYYGFFPLPDHQWEAREPSIRKAAPDLIYLADTYGVYTEEFYGKALGNRTTEIYAGLRPEEMKDIQAALPDCLTLVGEFNTFADPTSGEARQACEETFGLTWNGWIARFFKDLDRQGEMPPWAVRNWERQTGQEWQFEGPGFLLVNEEDQVEVLEEGIDVEPGRGLRFHGLSKGIADLDLPEDARYDYWFDLVQPKPGTEVLAEYELPLLPPGTAKLKARGLSPRTPALLASWKGRTRVYYFAVDFVDAWPIPNFTPAGGPRDLPAGHQPGRARQCPKFLLEGLRPGHDPHPG
jgi:hypothetical protein